MFSKIKLLGFILLAGMAGCERAEVVSYRVPKEDRMAQARKQLENAMGAPRPASSSTSSTSEISWKAPKEWLEQPATAMRKGSFKISGKNGQQADMSIVTFPGDAGGD